MGCGVGWFRDGCSAVAGCFSCAGSESVRAMLQLPAKAGLLLKLVSWKG